MERRRVTDRGLRANLRSYAAMVLGVAAVVVVPIITGPVALVVGILARNAEEPLARAGIWAAGVGTFLGLVNLFIAMGGS